MSARRVVYLAHSLRSDWNNGNAHFLRGLLRGLQAEGHAVTCLEPEDSWSYTNLLLEGERGVRSLAQFTAAYPQLDLKTYRSADDLILSDTLREAEVVIVHEWTERALIDRVLALQARYGFCTLFHDTHHRASSSPEQLKHLRIAEFDGILVFGEVLRTIYRQRWGATRVWTLHEAADTAVFYPHATDTRETGSERDLVWVGNWGDGERTEELRQYLLNPAQTLALHKSLIHGVRYPREALQALAAANFSYGGYLANLDAPAVFATAKVTVHIPRRQYAEDLPGIPTIRIFEALACGIPLVSAPWKDAESLFSKGDFLWAHSQDEMAVILRELLRDPAARRQQAEQGLAAIRAKHTTAHRAAQLSEIMEEALAEKVPA